MESKKRRERLKSVGGDAHSGRPSDETILMMEKETTKHKKNQALTNIRT